MNPGPILLAMSGHIVILVGLTALTYRLGRFTPSARERRSWPLLIVLAVVTVVVLAFSGPLPLPVILLMNVFSWGLLIWAWRTGKFSIDRVPEDLRAETEYRRRWMREHVWLLAGLGVAFFVASIVWFLVVMLFFLSG